MVEHPASRAVRTIRLEAPECPIRIVLRTPGLGSDAFGHGSASGTVNGRQNATDTPMLGRFGTAWSLTCVPSYRLPRTAMSDSRGSGGLVIE